MTPEQKLASLGLELSEVAAPLANYSAGKKVGPFIYVSGQIPVVEGEVAFRGIVGRDIFAEEAKSAARLCALNILAVAKNLAGNLSNVALIRIEGFVASAQGFTDQAKVIDGASKLLLDVLGDSGKHTRLAVGVASLPLGVPVEIGAIFYIK